MKIIHVTAGIQETCGVSQFVVNVARAQQAAGQEVVIVTTMTCGFPVDDLKVILTDAPVAAVDKEVGCKRDVVLHLHTLFGRYCISVARWARQNRVPYVISPHGALMPNAVKVNYWKKWIFLRFYAKEFRAAAGFHVTAESEIAAVKRFFGASRPIVLAPLGATPIKQSQIPNQTIPDQTIKQSPISNQTILNPQISNLKSTSSRFRDIVFVGRIHPVKNLTSLLRAWALSREKVEKRGGGGQWSERLIIAGSNDVGHQEELVELAKELGLKVVDFSHDLEYGKKTVFGGGEVPVETFQARLAECEADVVFPGPVYSAAKDWMFAHAWVSVLPSHSENFGGVVVESLAQGTPVIASRGTPWQELETSGCGWWTDALPGKLAEVLLSALIMDAAAHDEFSIAARRLVDRKYSWIVSAESLMKFYDEDVKSVKA